MELPRLPFNGETVLSPIPTSFADRSLFHTALKITGYSVSSQAQCSPLRHFEQLLLIL